MANNDEEQQSMGGWVEAVLKKGRGAVLKVEHVWN